MRWLSLVALLAVTAPSAADDCVTTTLRILYFAPEGPERSLAITENLRPPDDQQTAEPPPSPEPPAEGALGGGGIPACEPIIRPADDPAARQICTDAPTYGQWVCHTDPEGNLVIEDVRYAASNALTAPDASHAGAKN